MFANSMQKSDPPQELYLTACTWFEALFGQSCIGNTWRPDYDLSEEKIAALQQAAHEAVANMNN